MMKILFKNVIAQWIPNFAREANNLFWAISEFFLMYILLNRSITFWYLVKTTACNRIVPTESKLYSVLKRGRRKVSTY